MKHRTGESYIFICRTAEEGLAQRGTMSVLREITEIPVLTEGGEYGKEICKAQIWYRVRE